MFLMVMDMADSPKDQRKIVKLYEKYNRLMYVIAYNICLLYTSPSPRD